MNTGSFGFRPSRFASMKWPVSCRRISTTTPAPNFQPQMSAYAATAMKIEENLRRTNENFATASSATTSGARRRRSRPRQSVPRGWIGAYPRSGPGSGSWRSGSYITTSWCQTPVASRSAADPLLAARVDLLLPERHPFLELVDRVTAGGERVAPMRRRHGDHHRRLADPDAADAVVDRDRG